MEVLLAKQCLFKLGLTNLLQNLFFEADGFHATLFCFWPTKMRPTAVGVYYATDVTFNKFVGERTLVNEAFHLATFIRNY